MGTLFSETLTKIRKEAGFPTAYRFYHDNGGAPALKVSYRKYLRMEQGRILPVIDRLKRFLFALRLLPQTSTANQLIIAWLKTMAGEDAYDFVLAPLIAVKATKHGISPLHKAMRRVLSEKKQYITPAQFRTILSSRDTYLCSVAMESDTGIWSPETLAKPLRITKKAAAKAMMTLAKAGMLKEVKKGFFKYALTAGMVEYPHLNSIEQSFQDKLAGYKKELADTSKLHWARGCLIRADAAALRDFLPLMELNISTAQTYTITEKTENSAIFLVEGRVIKLRDF